MPATPELSVIIPVHQAELKKGPSSFLARLLESLIRQERAPSFETLVICNPSVSAPDWIPKNFPAVQWLGSSPAGANRARNTGIQNARGRVLLFLDADCRLVDPLFLARHWELHRKRPEISGVGGVYQLPDPAQRLDQLYHQIQLRWLWSGVGGDFLAAHLLGGNSSFKRDVFEKVSFSEDLTFGGTEVELHLQLEKLQYRLLLDPTLAVMHETGLTIPKLMKKAFAQGMGKAYMERSGLKKTGPRWVRADPDPPGAVFFDFCFDCGYRFGSIFRKTKVEPWERGLAFLVFGTRFLWRRLILHPAGLLRNRVKFCLKGAADMRQMH